MAALVPAIHVFKVRDNKTWMPGTGPGMTAERLLNFISHYLAWPPDLNGIHANSHLPRNHL
jgi:hypothetical protein